MNKERGYWTPERIDNAFSTSCKKLKRTPVSNEFRKSYPGAFHAIVEGRYNPEIKNWNDYLKSHGKSLNKINWNPNKIDRVFDELKEKLRRNPSYWDFVKLFWGALQAIEKGLYDPNIKTRNQYLKHRGIETPFNRWRDKGSWQDYGSNNGFNDRNPNSVKSSKLKDERSWYNRGMLKNWLFEFSFRRIPDKNIKNTDLHETLLLGELNDS